MNAQAIQSTDILVRFANPARDGKPPSICASDNTFYGVKPADFGRFQPGGRYRIEYIEKDGRGKWSGRKFRDIVKCEPLTLPAGSGDPAACRSAAASAKADGPSPSRQPAGGEGCPSEGEFVTRLLIAYVQSGGVDNKIEALVTRAKALQVVYRQVFL
jgi:hypothetical protein